MSRMRRKRMHHSIRDNQRKFRTRVRVKDLDQIALDLKTEKTEQVIDVDLPGLGQFECRECAKFFISSDPLEKHIASKVHKRRLRQLKDDPHTQKGAELAIGMKTDNGKRVVAILHE